MQDDPIHFSSLKTERSMGRELFLFVVLIVGGLLFLVLSDGVFTRLVEFFFDEQTTQQRFSQVYATLCIMVFPVLAWRSIHKEPFMLYLRARELRWRSIFYAVIFALIAQPAVITLAHFNSLLPLPDWALALEAKAEILVQQMLCTDSVLMFVANVFVIAIIPAVSEEMLFRGLLQSFFCKRGMNVHAAICLVGVIFGIIHFQFAGLLPRTFLGAVLGYLFYYSRSLWLPIIMHALNNMGAVVVYFIYTYNDWDISKGEIEFNLWLGLFSVVTTYLMLRLILLLRREWGVHQGVFSRSENL